MTKNMGLWDRWLRGLVLGPAALVAGMTVGAGTAGGIVLFVVAAVMVVTAIAGFCPLYHLLGITTGGPRRRPA